MSKNGLKHQTLARKNGDAIIGVKAKQNRHETEVSCGCLKARRIIDCKNTMSKTGDMFEVDEVNEALKIPEAVQIQCKLQQRVQ